MGCTKKTGEACPANCPNYDYDPFAERGEGCANDPQLSLNMDVTKHAFATSLCDYGNEEIIEGKEFPRGEFPDSIENIRATGDLSKVC